LASLVAPPQLRPVLWGMSFGVGALVKFALFDPFALTSIIVNYHRAIEGQEPDSAWESTLNKASDRFSELSDRALKWKEPRTGPAPA